MEDLVLSIEQCRHLQELGLDMSDAKMYWTMCVGRDGKKNRCVLGIKDGILERCYSSDDIVSTYTLQEIWEKLPDEIPYDDFGTICELNINTATQSMVYETPDRYYTLHGMYSKNLLETSYNMLCWVIENGYLKK